MRLSLTLVDGRNGRAVDALLDFDVASPVGDLVPTLTALLGERVHESFARRVPVWVDGRAVALQTPAGQAGLTNGAVVSIFEQADRIGRGVPAGVAEIRVVGGPGAGRVHRLPLGETVIGCGAVGWSLPDLRLPVDALVVEVTPDGDVHVSAAAGLGARLEQEQIDGRVGWPVDAYLFAGDTVLARVAPSHARAELLRNPDEALLDFNRQPRLLPPTRVKAFHLPDDAGEPMSRPIPWVMVFAPLLIAVPMAILLSPRFMLFALFSPLMMLANYVSERKRGMKEHKRKVREYAETLAAVNERVDAAVRTERADLRRTCPDPAELLLHALGPGPRLWERRVGDPDYLRLRLGLVDLPTSVKVEERRAKTEEAPEPRLLESVPAWLNVAEVGIVGLAGEREVATPVAQWLVAQVGLLHSPRDARIVVLTDPGGADRWSWVRWLPHARVDGLSGDALALGTRQESVVRRLSELTALIDSRLATKGRDRIPPDVVVVLDGARRLRALPAVVDLLQRGPSVGIRVICLDEEVRQLPEECRAVVSAELGRLRLHESSADDLTGILPDLVEAGWCETVARSVAPLRDTTPEEEAVGLPDSSRLLEEIDLDPPTPDKIAARWAQGRTTDVVVGAGYDGPFRLDLRRDGPHALIAGTTGSGKSELLQTLVASLAVANRPDELTFVLVDYKGGSAFKDCARLPHTVGMVTDLDAHLVRRALVSLGAELHRREQLLAGPGAKDLEDYWALQRSRPDLPPIPRLVLVIDEFASMVAELPAFVSGLVSIAQRGRSLGIHLVLATQRPRGVVSADIRANTNLRISLRVTDEDDSRDIIDAPDAARILKSQPGRAFVRSGASTLVPFQSGRVGGRAPSVAAGAAARLVPLAWPIGWEDVGLPAPARPRDTSHQTDEADTDLAHLVDAITVLNDRLGVPQQHRPWLDALPEMVTVAELPAAAPTRSAVGEPAPAPWALVDVPAKQAQAPRVFQLGRDGHLFVIGGPRSGRSTAMRTLAGSLADVVPRRDLHIHGLDCGNGALLGLARLPHAGAIVPRSSTDRAERLLARLRALVEERQALLGRCGYADLGELRSALPPDERPPYVLLLIDRWDGFTSTLGEVDGGRLTEQVMMLLRDGAAVGMHVVVSGDRTLVTGRLSTLVENRLVLRLADRGDFSAVGIPGREVPDHLPDGRGLVPDPTTELQVAVLDRDVSGAGQNEALRRIAARHADRDAACPSALRPFKLEEMPAVAPLEGDLAALVDGRADDFKGGWTPFGIGGDDLDLVGLDLSGAPVAVIAGPAKSGRTNTLRLTARLARAGGVPVLGLGAVKSALLEELGAEAMLAPGLTEDAFVDRLRDLPTGALVLVDDAELLKDGPLAAALQGMVQQARAKGWRVLLAGNTADVGSGYSGFIYDARKSRQGLLLCPQGMADADIYSARLQRSQLMNSVHPGRGVVIDAAGASQLVQVPLVP